VKPGYGSRHPCIDRLIANGEQIARERADWPNGLQLMTTAYRNTPDDVEDDLIRSVRCITRVGNGVVVCETPHDEHIVPGGRREPGESFLETAVREVCEETGWHVDPATVTHLGLWHIEFLNPEIGDPALPRPDVVQVVLTGVATDRECDVDAVWTDTEGWEQGSRVVPLDELAQIGLPPCQRVFVDLLERGPTL
jgi:8-oxo-dGTP pyrophosphatase MutT (NUDIX family)